MGDIGPEISYMGIVIHRGTASIKTNFARGEGLKFL
jgi:hypothetical protein